MLQKAKKTARVKAHVQQKIKEHNLDIDLKNEEKKDIANTLTPSDSAISDSLAPLSVSSNLKSEEKSHVVIPKTKKRESKDLKQKTKSENVSINEIKKSSQKLEECSDSFRSDRFACIPKTHPNTESDINPNENGSANISYPTSATELTSSLFISSIEEKADVNVFKPKTSLKSKLSLKNKSQDNDPKREACIKPLMTSKTKFNDRNEDMRKNVSYLSQKNVSREDKDDIDQEFAVHNRPAISC